MHQGFFVVAGVGLERPSRVACRFLSQTSLAQKASRFGSTVPSKATLWLCFVTNPLPPVAEATEDLAEIQFSLRE